MPRARQHGCSHAAHCSRRSHFQTTAGSDCTGRSASSATGDAAGADPPGSRSRSSRHPAALRHAGCNVAGQHVPERREQAGAFAHGSAGCWCQAMVSAWVAQRPRAARRVSALPWPQLLPLPCASPWPKPCPALCLHARGAWAGLAAGMKCCSVPAGLPGETCLEVSSSILPLSSCVLPSRWNRERAVGCSAPNAYVSLLLVTPLFRAALSWAAEHKPPLPPQQSNIASLSNFNTQQS